MTGAGPVEWLTAPPGVESDHVEGDCGEHVLEVGFGQAAAAGVTCAGGGDGLVHGGFGAGPDGLAGLPVGAVLRAAGGELGLVELGWGHGELPSGALGGSALGTDRARHAGRGVERDDGRVGAALGARAPRRAGLALRAAGLPGVEVDVEADPVEPGARPGLRAGVGQQWADQLDAEIAQRPADLSHRGVSRIEVVLGGQQFPLRQRPVDRGGSQRKLVEAVRQQPGAVLPRAP